MSSVVDPKGVLAEVNEQLLINMLEAQVTLEAQAKALQEVRRHAEIDPLTQLPNRVLLFDRCAQAIAAADRHRGRLALFFLDIDDFKKINDGGGHPAGDLALRSAATRLLSVVRAVDTVSRFGGDEFVILVSEIVAATDAALIAAKVIEALGIPDSGAPGLNASIGISIYPDDGLDPETLLRLADAAMYVAKQAGGRRWSLASDRAGGSSGGGPVGAAGRGDGLEPRSTPDRLPLLNRIKDGSYRFDLRAHGYDGSGSAAKNGPRIAGGDDVYRFWGSINESGGHATASVTVRVDGTDAGKPTVEKTFTMQMTGSIEHGRFSLLGIGPLGVIIEIDCFGPDSEGAEDGVEPGR